MELAIALAMEVFPTPGGPHKIMEGNLFLDTALLIGQSSPNR